MNAYKILEDSAKYSGSIICMGLDPVEKQIPDSCGKTPGEKISNFYLSIFDRMEETGIYPAMFKPNQGFFKQYDKSLDFEFEGSVALADLILEIRDRESMRKIPITLDFKRGDIGKSSANYAVEGFESWGADAVTIHPYMGSDSVKPFANYEGKIAYVLTRTSNEGRKDMQDLVLQDGRKLYQATAREIVNWNSGVKGTLGSVLGATSPDELEDAARYFVEVGMMVPVLIPGVGAQGGSGNDVRKRLDKAGYDLKRARINSSSGISFRYLEKGKETKDFAGASIQGIEELNKDIGKLDF